MFPTSMLNKVYVAKSLKNTPDGFEFTLKNTIDSGTLSGVKKLTADGVEIPLEAVRLKTGLGEKTAAEITPRSAVPLRYNAEIVVSVAGQPLASGKHELKLAVNVFEAGGLELKIEDEI